MREATEWMEPYRRFWDASLDRLDAHLKRQQGAQTPTSQATDMQSTDSQTTDKKREEAS